MQNRCNPLFFGWVLIFSNADPDRGFAPIAGEVRMSADFFIFLIWIGSGLRVRMGGERRFASLLRIGAPPGVREFQRGFNLICKYAK